MILTDAGPLIALIDSGEKEHQLCVATVSSLRVPMLTTWPAFAEAMYLLSDAAGWQAQETLWRVFMRGDLVIEMPAKLERVVVLMRQYSDLPMDLADATLVALAEERGLCKVFTLDNDFRVYRLGRYKHFHIVP